MSDKFKEKRRCSKCNKEISGLSLEFEGEPNTIVCNAHCYNNLKWARGTYKRGKAQKEWEENKAKARLNKAK